MIRIVTVHHHVTDWLPLQRQYLDRVLKEPYLLYGSLEGLDDEYNRFVDVVIECRDTHAGKLNHMARVVLEEADPDDLIMFLDGDAFPVADPMELVRNGLRSSSLVAVQRLENYGDCQPHPCFTVVSARTWAELSGDWSSGYCYRDGRTDVGGNLLWQLEHAGLNWEPILRSHSLRDHSLLYGIYGGVLYHHGAGFRGLKPPGKGRENWEPKQPANTAAVARMEQMQDRHPERFEKFLGAAMQTSVESFEVWEQIVSDDQFFERFFANERT